MSESHISALGRIEFEETRDLFQYLRMARNLIRTLELELEEGAVDARAAMAGMVKVGEEPCDRRAKRVVRHIARARTDLAIARRNLARAQIAFAREFAPELNQAKSPAKRRGMRVTGAA